MYYLRFTEEVKKKLIKHTFINPNLECGGFLYGKLKRHGLDVICDVDDIYYENLTGDEANFRFRGFYVCHALEYQILVNKDLLGTYHSHGQYPAVLSDVDHDELQQRFGKNGITVVYSPKYSQLVSEFLDRDGVSHRMKILSPENKKFNF